VLAKPDVDQIARINAGRSNAVVNHAAQVLVLTNGIVADLDTHRGIFVVPANAIVSFKLRCISGESLGGLSLHPDPPKTTLNKNTVSGLMASKT